MGFGSLSYAEGELQVTPRHVDLHGHYFFHEGVGLAWFGSFTGPIRASSWKDRIRSKINEADLIHSDSEIAVVALYSHPLFLSGQRESLRRQILEAENFVKANPDWIIARSPNQAQQALSQGKRILILSIEGASGTLETEDDLREFIDEKGVRIVTPFHFMNDEFGAGALLPGIQGLVNPLAWIESFFGPRSVEGLLLNRDGITEKGHWLITELMKRGVWIDFAHASDRDEADILPMLSAAHWPVLVTHTMLREFYHSERGISSSQLKVVKQSGGIVGLLPSEDMIGKTEVGPEFCQSSRCPEATCGIGLAHLATQWKTVSAIIGSENVSFGTDIDAPLNFMPPECSTDDSRGFFHYAQLPELWTKLEQRLGSTVNNPVQELTPQRFIQVWSRVRPYSPSR